MAERRMFSKSVTDSDAFLDMPLSTQALYFHLGMHADDDGFLNSPKRVQRMASATDDDMRLLEAKGFVIRFDSGVVVIRHWKVNNYIQSDRYHKTMNTKEFEMLATLDNRTYALVDGMNQLLVEPVDQRKESEPKEKKHHHGEYGNVMLTDQQMMKLQSEFPNDWQGWIDKVDQYCQSTGKRYKDYLATIRNWSRKDKMSKPENIYEGEF